MNNEMRGDFGYLKIKFGKIRGQGARVTNEFLRRLLRQIVTRSTKFYDEAKSKGGPDYRDHIFT